MPSVKVTIRKNTCALIIKESKTLSRFVALTLYPAFNDKPK